MDFLVTMTTHVPPGTPERAVDDMRAREAAHSGQLATQGKLLRLWRPPLHPGEWRTLGLFTAEDATELEDVLAAMPLRVWRADDVTPLFPHPNDPMPPTPPSTTAADGDGGEFLTAFTLAFPADTTPETVDANLQLEAARTRELDRQGHLERFWTMPGRGRSLALWQAHDVAEVDAIVESLPLYPWMTVQTTALTPHPSDPATARG
jgi:muconolactone delta-isomerase